MLLTSEVDGNVTTVDSRGEKSLLSEKGAFGIECQTSMEQDVHEKAKVMYQLSSVLLWRM